MHCRTTVMPKQNRIPKFSGNTHCDLLPKEPLQWLDPCSQWSSRADANAFHCYKWACHLSCKGACRCSKQVYGGDTRAYR